MDQIILSLLFLESIRPRVIIYIKKNRYIKSKTNFILTCKIHFISNIIYLLINLKNDHLILALTQIIFVCFKNLYLCIHTQTQSSCLNFTHFFHIFFLVWILLILLLYILLYLSIEIFNHLYFSITINTNFFYQQVKESILIVSKD